MPLIGRPAIRMEAGKRTARKTGSAAPGIKAGKRKFSAWTEWTAQTFPSAEAAVPAMPSRPPPGRGRKPLQMSAIALCIERPLARKRVSSSSPGVVARAVSGGPKLPSPFSHPRP